MTHQQWLEEPYQRDVLDEAQRTRVWERCEPDDDWHPGVIQRYTTYFDNTFNNLEEPMSFDDWLEHIGPHELLLIVTEWHDKNNDKRSD